jgi:putative FmdB family regulatory protein
MPTYLYHCSDNACDHEWEATHSMADEDVQKQCPKCNQETAKRMITTTNFVLVGGGWASSGYSNK